MATIIFFFLIINIFSYSFQKIQAVFFCDDVLKDIYVVEGNIQRKIEEVYEGNFETPYVFNELNAAPGDLIKFNCMNREGFTFGAGCFVLNNLCYCYDFNNTIPKNSNYYLTREYNFGNIHCSIDVHYLLEERQIKDYIYEHYIPLDVSKLSCKNSDNVLIYINGLDYH